MADKTVLITGANRGIGLEFVTQYTALGWQVIAACRTPDDAAELQDLASREHGISVEPLDVTDHIQVSALASKYKDTAIDVLLNNAGSYGDLKRQTWGTLDPALFHELLDINVLGPMKVIESFVPNVANSNEKKIVAITSFLGSIGSVSGPPMTPFYGLSKAALNMAMRGASQHFKEQGIATVVFMPGLVKTRMLRQTFGLSQSEAETVDDFDYRDLNPITATESVSNLIPLIDALSVDTTGRFLNYDGSEIPW